jgi:L-asparaginase
MKAQSKRRVALIGTGGTISSIGRGSLDLWEYMDAGRKAEPDELLLRFPEVAEAAEIVALRFRSVSSAAVGPADWLALGVLVLLNDEIQAAREVTKTSTLRLETFRSPDVGMLGYADPDGRVAIYRRPARRHAPETEFDVRGRAELPRVDIAASYAGADGAAIRAFVAAGTRAIVSASLAPGVTTPAETEALLEARRHGVLVVLSSRAGSGRVLPRTVLREQGFVVADNLNPQKARVLAMLALTRTDDVAEVQRMFDEY